MPIMGNNYRVPVWCLLGCAALCGVVVAVVVQASKTEAVPADETAADPLFTAATESPSAKLSNIDNDVGNPLSAETTVRCLIDRAIALRAGPSANPAGINVATYLAQTPAGKRHLRAIVERGDPKRARWAVYFLTFAPETADAPRLLACAERHLDDNDLAATAIDCFWPLVCTNYSYIGRGREDHLKGIADIRRWLGEHKKEVEGKTYIDLAAARFDAAWKRVRWNDSDENEELLNYAFYGFLEATDAQHATPHVVRWISQYDLWTNTSGILPGMIRGLQMYVGPLDVPEREDIRGQRKSQAAIADWWTQNKGKKPVVWLLEALARHGYSASDPADQVKTSQGLISALKNGSPAERYAAARVLAYVLPDGDGIPANRRGGDILAPPEGSALSTPSSEYIDQMILCRAMRWAVLDRHTYRWNSDSLRYEHDVNMNNLRQK
jgi:hypothetical protein